MKPFVITEFSVVNYNVLKEKFPRILSVSFMLQLVCSRCCAMIPSFSKLLKGQAGPRQKNVVFWLENDKHSRSKIFFFSIISAKEGQASTLAISLWIVPRIMTFLLRDYEKEQLAPKARKRSQEQARWFLYLDFIITLMNRRNEHPSRKPP